MTDTDTAALLPCPFCGGGAAYDFDNTMVAPYGHMLTCNRCATTSGSSPSKEHAIAAWNRRTATPPTDDEREGLARAIAFELDIDPDDGRAHEAMARTVRPLATAALSYLAPIRAREIAAAEARGLERAREVVADCRISAASEPARSDDWQDGVLTGMDTVGFAIFAEINAIERGEHDTGKEG